MELLYPKLFLRKLMQVMGSFVLLWTLLPMSSSYWLLKTHWHLPHFNYIKPECHMGLEKNLENIEEQLKEHK